MDRKVWIVVVAVLVIGGAFAGVWWWRNAGEAAPQTVTLPNGVTYRFAGVTYGTNHVMGSRLEMAVQRMPKPLANIARQLFGSQLGNLNTHTTSKPELCIWFEPLGTNGVAAITMTYAMLASDSGAMSGKREQVSTSLWVGTPPWLRLDFPAFPRRSRMLACAFFEDLPGGGYREFARVSFPNPLFGEHPQWQPEPLPATKMAGDVEVRLESFQAAQSGSSFGTTTLPNGKSVVRVLRPKPGVEVHAAFELNFKSPRGTNEVWAIESAELSDATGNQLRASDRAESEGRIFVIGPTPWPDEQAWKLKLELERKGAFLPEELVIFSAVRVPAVGETNSIALSNQLAGVEFKRVEFRRKDDITGRTWSSSSATQIRLEHSKVPQGYSLDFVSIVAGNGAKLEVLSRSWSDTSCEFAVKSIPAGVEGVDITYAVQQTRTVEFLVKPEIAAPDPPK